MPSKETVLQIDGELTIARAEELHRSITGEIARGMEVRVDLAGVQKCDTAGLQLICSIHKTADRTGQAIAIVALSPAIEETAAVIGLPVRDLLASREEDTTDSAAPFQGGSSRGV
ncbi:MAG TPA: STAS domain-containing protein [Verrucomicrobiae bacterium]|nr:STAS domain-containing protein [Verrucomicrobiae bacterium]